MCILFMYIANCAKVSNSEPKKIPTYKLIVATNRDEKYSRPSQPAHFWEDIADSHIVAGRDLEELGTWLGVSKHGKFSIVLNIMGSPQPPATTGQATVKQQISRGCLITGFLRSPPGFAGWTYCNSLCHDPVNLDIRKLYKPFHLLTIDIRGKYKDSLNSDCNTNVIADPSTICVTYLSNRTSCAETYAKPQYMTPQLNTCQYYAFGNSIIDKSFLKVTCGREKFIEIVDKYSGEEASASRNESLTKELLEFLRSKEKFYPDEVIEDHAKSAAIPSDLLQHLSSRFVNVPGYKYGTRTQTIILVDSDNNVTFQEWTLRDPIDPSKPDWKETKYQFVLTPPN